MSSAMVFESAARARAQAAAAAAGNPRENAWANLGAWFDPDL